MFKTAANPLADWLWKDLYVWPEGRLTRGAYLGALLRIMIIYVIFAQILTIFGSSMTPGFQDGGAPDFFRGMVWGQVGALVLIAFPAWSVFQRRANDFRPDYRQKLANWTFAFPIIFAGLLVVAIINSLGYGFILSGFDLGDVRQSFAIMLVGAAFVPGGDMAPVPAKLPDAKPQRDLFQTEVRKATREALAAQITAKPAGRHLPMPHTDRPKPVPVPATSPVIQRSYKLPEQGRVKPGWFS